MKKQTYPELTPVFWMLTMARLLPYAEYDERPLVAVQLDLDGPWAVDLDVPLVRHGGVWFPENRLNLYVDNADDYLIHAHLDDEGALVIDHTYDDDDVDMEEAARLLHATVAGLAENLRDYVQRIEDATYDDHQGHGIFDGPAEYMNRYGAAL